MRKIWNRIKSWFKPNNTIKIKTRMTCDEFHKITPTVRLGFLSRPFKRYPGILKLIHKDTIEEYLATVDSQHSRCLVCDFCTNRGYECAFYGRYSPDGYKYIPCIFLCLDIDTDIVFTRMDTILEEL